VIGIIDIQVQPGVGRGYAFASLAYVIYGILNCSPVIMGVIGVIGTVFGAYLSGE